MKAEDLAFSHQFQKEIFGNRAFDFSEKALKLFYFQYENNEVYRNYCDQINCKPENVKQLEDIPFLPISFFKSHKVVSGKIKPSTITFTSSGTSGTTTSKHYVKDASIYKESFTRCFEQFYDSIEDYCILGLLPSYLERNDSSLIYMVNCFIERSVHEKSGFFLNNTAELFKLLQNLNSHNKKVLLIGVSFALLDFAEEYQLSPNPNLVIMETGGMKGRRKEMIRKELHDELMSGLNQKTIHSEYGMTELLSQAYSKSDGWFECPPWMKILIREQDDPFSYTQADKTGAINIIDLANIYSCAFIQTDDLGRMNNSGKFEVLGRFDASDVRGCNLMVL